MRLQSLKKSLLEMTREEQITVHREIRKSRMDWTKVTRKTRKTAPSTTKRETKAMKEIKKDPEKIKALLRLLGEDV